MTLTDKLLNKSSQQAVSVSLLTAPYLEVNKPVQQGDASFNDKTALDATANIQIGMKNLCANEVDCGGISEKVEGKVDSFDHVTFWVGNAKQSAVFYMTQFGFQPFAFRGLETGSRDVACHVVKLNDTLIQFVSAVEPNNQKLNKFLLSHGDAVKDVAFRVENIEELLKHALEQGAELVSDLEVVLFNPQEQGAPDKSPNDSLKECILKRATIKTFGDVTHTFIERNYEYGRGKFLPGYNKPSLEVSNLPFAFSQSLSLKFTNIT